MKKLIDLIAGFGLAPYKAQFVVYGLIAAAALLFVILIASIFNSCGNTAPEPINEKQINEQIQNMSDSEREKRNTVLTNSGEGEQKLDQSIKDGAANTNKKFDYSNTNNAQLANELREKINK